MYKSFSGQEEAEKPVKRLICSNTQNESFAAFTSRKSKKQQTG